MKVFIVIMVALLVIMVPLLSIWALNTLFGLAIAYTFKTWLAALLLGAAIGVKR